MTNRHTLLVVSVALAILVSPTILAQETATTTQNTTNESETAGMGTQLTAFTQSSSAAVNDSVENGMWRAGFNQSNASERTQLVQDRTGTLEQRLERLQRQNESLQERYENGSLPEAAYVAQQSRLSARIDGLRTAINDTDEAAAQADVNDSRLERLRQNASDLKGPEVAAIARGLGGGPPADRGPPGERGPSANRTQGGDSPGADAGNAPDRGQSESADVGNATDRGQSGSADTGNTTDSGNAAGSTSSGDGATDGDATNGSDGSTGGQNGGSDDAEERGNGGGQGSDAPERS